MAAERPAKLLVQVVGNAMTLAAFWKGFMHGDRMWFAVTAGTLGNHLMILLMTGGAGELGMLGLAGVQLVQDILMAAGTACRGDF